MVGHDFSENGVRQISAIHRVAFTQLIKVTSCHIPLVVPINQIWVAAVVKSTFIIIMASHINPN